MASTPVTNALADPAVASYLAPTGIKSSGAAEVPARSWANTAAAVNVSTIKLVISKPLFIFYSFVS